MSELEEEFVYELIRSIKLLGGKEDILGSINVINGQLPGREALSEALGLVKCWNDEVEESIPEIPENPIYADERFKRHQCT